MERVELLGEKSRWNVNGDALQQVAQRVPSIAVAQKLQPRDETRDFQRADIEYAFEPVRPLRESVGR